MAELLSKFMGSTVAEELVAIYSDIFLHTEATTSLLASPPETIIAFITKASTLQPAWTSTRAAVKFKELCGLNFVASLKKANDAYLYSIALAAGLDPGYEFELDASQADLAFHLSDVWATAAGRPQHAAAGAAAAAAPVVTGGGHDEDRHMRDSSDDSGEDETWDALEWETERVPLPGDLEQVLGRLTQGTLQLDAKSLFDRLPRFQGLKERSEQNNYRADRDRRDDKVLKHLQQRVLSLQRIFAVVHTHVEESGRALSQQCWALLAMLEQEIVKERKKNSLPSVVPGGEPQLFSVMDLKQADAQMKIDRTNHYPYSGKGSAVQNQTFSFPSKVFPTVARSSSTSCLLPHSGKGTKFRRGYKSGYGKAGKGWNPSGWKGGKGGRGGKESVGEDAGAQGATVPLSVAPGQATVPSGKCSSVATVPDKGDPLPCSVVPNPASGIGMVKHSIVSAFENVPALVGQVGFPLSGPHHQGGHQTTMVRPPRNVHHREGTGQCGPGRKDPSGIRTFWGSQKGQCRRHKPSHSLVSVGKGGTLRRKEMAVHKRLSPAQHPFSSQKILLGPHARHLPTVGKKSVGSKDRPQGRLSPCGGSPLPPTLSSSSGGVSDLGISKRALRAQHHARGLSKGYENLRTKMAPSRSPSLYLFGRHFDPRAKSKSSPKAFGSRGHRSLGQRLQDKHKEVGVNTHPTGATFGFPAEFSTGKSPANSTKDAGHPERVGEVCHQAANEQKTGFSHFGQNPSEFTGSPFPSGFHLGTGKLSGQQISRSLGPKISHPSRNQRGVGSGGKHFGNLGRKVFSRKAHKGAVLRLQRSVLGGAKPRHRRKGTGVLEKRGKIAHKSKRTAGCSSHCQVTGEEKRGGPTECGQPSVVSLPQQGGGEKKPLQSHPTALLQVPYGKQHQVASQVGALREMPCRPDQQVVSRQGGLHPTPLGVRRNKKIFSTPHSFGRRSLCFPRQQQVRKVRLSLATLAGSCSGCSASSTGGPGKRILLQPTLVNNLKVPTQDQGIPKPPIFDGSALLGFRHVVAPVNKAEGATHQMSQDSTLQGLIRKLLGPGNAPPQVGPDLHSLLRQILQSRKVQSSTVNDFFARNPSIKRYNTAFKVLWTVLQEQNIAPESASLEQVADAIIQIFQVSPSQARNAYSGVLLIPGFSQLRFVSLLSPYKRLWNLNVEKYGTFYDPWPILLQLAKIKFSDLISSLPALRRQFILCSRFLCLYRSSDLANMKRCVSVVTERPFIKLRRKGQKFPKWERILSLPDWPQISPAHLLQAYVAATRRQGKPGGPVLLSLQAPFRALSADRVGSITKQCLADFGVAAFFGPHSTRGAGVGLMKTLGLSGEQVCDIGKWKSVESFCSHYQRLNSQDALSQALKKEFLTQGVGVSVHKTSPRGSAETEVSRTPPSSGEGGGRDTEGEAQSLGEVMSVCRLVFVCFWSGAAP